MGGTAVTRPRILVEILQERAKLSPGKLAYSFFVGPDSIERWTYGALELESRRIAAALQRVTKPGERALLLYSPGLEFVAAFWSCLFAGVVAVPAYPPRWNRSDSPLAAITRDCKPALVLTTSALRSKAAVEHRSFLGLEEVPWIETDALDSGLADDWQPVEITPDDLAFLQYTSGSTSSPKGVSVSHCNLMHNEEMIRQAFGQSEKSVVVSWLPPYHDMGLTGTLLQPVYSGGTAHLMSPVSFLERPIRWLQAISRLRATTSGGPTFAYDHCVRKTTAAERGGLDLSCWEVAFIGAEPIRAEVLERFAEAFGPCGFRRQALYPCYGLAEATLFVTGGCRSTGAAVWRVSQADLVTGRAVAAQEQPGRALVSCGSAWGDQAVLIVDPESGLYCAEDAVGEIWIAGASVAQGYWAQLETTREAFHARPADGRCQDFLRTGDLGFLHEGQLFVTGRLKDLIILRGRNYYPQDLEAAVERCHPALRPGCGAAFSMELEGEERLVVALEVERTWLARVNPAEVAQAVREAIAREFELQVYLVALLRTATIPKTTSGKIRRSACRAGLFGGQLPILALCPLGESERVVAPLAPAGQPEREGLSSLRLPERRSAVEHHLRWRLSRMTGIEPDRLRPDVPLVALGLDSLAMVELLHSLEAGFGVTLELELLREVSLGDLAEEVLARWDLEAAGDEAEGVPGELAEGAAFPLSQGQRALWLFDRLAPAEAVLNLASLARAGPNLDAAALQRAFAALIRRHPALRTAFVTRGDGLPEQRVEEDIPIDFLEVDVTGWDGERLRSAVAEEVYRPFDIESARLLRMRVFHRSLEAPLVCFVIHHLAADFWSLAVMADELGRLYRMETGGLPADLPQHTAGYARYVIWQQRMLAGPRGKRLWSYWKERLGGELPVLELPTDRPRPPTLSFEGRAEALRLGPEAALRTQELAARERATLFTLLFTTFLILLQRWTGLAELVVSTPTTGRRAAWLSGLVGYLVNPVVLRSELADDPSFAEFLVRTRIQAADAFEHGDFPFGLLVERLQPQRDAGPASLARVMFAFQKAPRAELEPLASFALGEGGGRLLWGDLELESAAFEPRRAQLDLTLMTARLGDDLAASVQYRAGLFDAVTIRRLLGHFQALLTEVVAFPSRRVSELTLLFEAERHQIAFEWAATDDVPGGDRTLGELFASQARRSPDAVAVLWAGNSCPHIDHLTYAELARRADALSSRLRALGAGPEVPIGVFLERGPRLVLSLLGVLGAAGAYVPLDPEYPPERIAFMLADSGVPMVLTEARLAGRLRLASGATGKTFHIVVVDDGDGPAAADPARSPRATRQNLAYLIYTSGSSGRPKGVAIEHRSAVALVQWSRGVFPQESLTGVLASTSICFDLSVFELFVSLSRGGTVVLVDNVLALATSPLAPAVSLVNTVPSAFGELLETAGIPAGVQTVNLAGEPLRRELADRVFHSTCAERVLNLYGPSEDTTYSTWSPVARGSGSEPTIGRPIAGTRACVLDHLFRFVPIGVPGEVFLGGEGLARGYLRRPELTAERFVPNPLAGRAAKAGDRLYRTGDLACYTPGGEIELLGRIDHQVKVRGYRIELGEIEAVLMSHPGVREAAVLAREDQPGNRRLVAYVALEREAGEELFALRGFLRDRLPAAMVPAVFVPLPELPRTPNGKLDRKALPAPEGRRPDLAASYTAPRSDLEQAIASLWQDVLGLEKVGVDDNFFDLGGHSLLVSQVQSRLRKALGADLQMIDLFRHPTIRTLARRLRSGEPPPRAERPSARPQSSGHGRTSSEIAIIGMAGRFPGAASPEELWRRLCLGEECLSFFSDRELIERGVDPALLENPAFVRAGGVLAGAELFDARFFGYSPHEAEVMHPQHRVFLECAWEALESAGYDPARYPGRIGVYAGVGASAFSGVSAADGLPSEQYEALIGNAGDFVPTRVSYKLNLRGPSVNVQTACSSSLVALHLARQALLAGECDLALAGGISIRLPQGVGYLWQEGGILSPDGRCRAFDVRAQGTVLGNGAGIVVLKRLDDALAGADNIRAVIKSTAVNNDGALKIGYTAPSLEGLAGVIAEAMMAAAVEPDTITYIEAHGTATPLGDPIEVAALTQVFAARTRQRGFCALGSVKTNLGHLDAAAGVAGLIKTTLALEHGLLPPSLHFETPNPKTGLVGSPFYVNAELAEWRRIGGGPRRAGVSSFGIGGTNAHVVLEEARPTPSGPSRPFQLLMLSAKTPGALEATTCNLAERLADNPDLPLADVAFTLHLGRGTFGH
ncbi:MAG TPA: amino acid adenylation domain-containing protein, partial [Thermoanaerobaculia bacterium]|nr:amino acid adenylation domain-containing protein [Thermoanaerobaculia bacterium]